MMNNNMENYQPSGTKIILKKIKKDLTQIYDGIIIPETLQRNEKLSKAIVHKIGPQCKYNINEGDIVLYDTMSVFDDAFPYVITKEENVIIKLEE